MRHLIFIESPTNTYPVALLIKQAAFQQRALQESYVTPLHTLGIPAHDIIGFTLKYNDQGKAPASFQKDYLASLLPALDRLGVKYLYCCDGAYFKTLTRQTKAEPHYGYALPCRIKGFEHMQIILGVNHQSLIYNPDLHDRLSRTLTTLASATNQTYIPPGTGIIQQADYPESVDDIKTCLTRLLSYNNLTCDIETFGLDFTTAGIATIAFGTSLHSGTAFAVDYYSIAADSTGFHGIQQINLPVRTLLKDFFTQYTGTLIWHNATFDLKMLIAALWMTDPLDMQGLLDGLHIMCHHFHDTQIMTYLATNSTAGNTLSLKEQAQEFAGNWAQSEIKDVRRIPLPELLQYNLVDALSTWYVMNKHWPTLVADQQETIYTDLMLPAIKTLVQTELSGMPMDRSQVTVARQTLEELRDEYLVTIHAHPLITQLNQHLQYQAMERANSKLKKKQHPLEAFSSTLFNPNSGTHLQQLLYELMGLPVIDYTDTRQPATGADTLEKLVHHTNIQEHQDFLKAVIGYNKVTKILGTFITAFEEATQKADGWYYLHGSFKLGGTVSGRLSSSEPNLQNIPAGSTYGKLVKQCFQAPPGWLFVGADFNGLEDRINTLLTRDPAKEKVFIDGYDGHCLRAYSYFRDQMPDIVDTVESINSIAEKYKNLRQESKSPSFALQYQGTWRTMVTNLGWPEDKAKQVEARYHDLYQVSDAWVQARIEQASKDGYATGAFGLRIRTPLLKQVLLGTAKVPREAEAEARTLGNAISGQSYGLLTNRALNAFMETVWRSEYATLIKPVALIHDALYFQILDRVDVVEWVNTHLIETMQWQDLPELAHPQIHLGAQLDIYWPNWATPLTLPNSIDRNEIERLAAIHQEKHSP